MYILVPTVVINGSHMKLSFSLTADAQQLDETIQHNLLLGMKKSGPIPSQKFLWPDRVSWCIGGRVTAIVGTVGTQDRLLDGSTQVKFSLG